ncbi:MAG: hypothetical protein OEN20_09940, partial [Gammaproteobacteria bacterium]|nr:hypothetical protein [Gammaproteobacteria bacterium]
MNQKHHSAGPEWPKDSIPVAVSNQRQKGKIRTVTRKAAGNARRQTKAPAHTTLVAARKLNT